MALPKTLQPNKGADTTATFLPPANYVRFYFRGATPQAIAHLTEIKGEVEAAGHHLSDAVWITPLTLWQDTATGVAEYRVQLK
jgi:hypothetical protein